MNTSPIKKKKRARRKKKVEPVKEVEDYPKVKPKAQMSMEAAGKSMGKKKQVVINMAKWEAANAYAKQRKIRFRVVSEEQLFHQGTRK